MTAALPSWLKGHREGAPSGLGTLGLSQAKPARPAAPDAAGQDKAGQGKTGQGKDGQDRAGQGRAGIKAALRLSEADAVSPEVLALAEAVMPHLGGIRSVAIRVCGTNREIGPALGQLLQRQGFDVSVSSILQIVPPPRTRHAVRYHAGGATVTLAPDLPA